jgi:hypothetical protein
METFKSTTEWLRAPEVSPGISTARESLGVMLGAADWYAQEARLEELLEFLNEPVQQRLAAELAQAVSDYDRESWTFAVMTAYRYGEPVSDENYGMDYRYDKLLGAYEWEDPRSPGTWLSQEEADLLAAQWARDDPAAAAEAAWDPAAEWDENWGMFYRLDPDGTYRYAHAAAPGAVESGPDGRWLTYEEAAAARVDDEELTGEQLERALRALFEIPDDQPIVIIP